MKTRKLLWCLAGAGAGVLAIRALQKRCGATVESRAVGDAGSSLPKASLIDTLSILAEMALPTLAKGPIIRRPKIVGLAERFALDERALKRMQKIREKYGDGPLLVPVPTRLHGYTALILKPEHVTKVLEGTPEPFTPATVEKHGALSHFEPKNALISQGAERAERRRFNEEVLDTPCPRHRLADAFLSRLEEEAAGLLQEAQQRGDLAWVEFFDAWFRLVRRVVFGDFARHDRELTNMLVQLRRRGNFSFFAPQDEELRERFLARVRSHLAKAEPGSIASLIADYPQNKDTAPEHQVAQWLFAFDPAAMATFRALALLATHPQQMARAREEISSVDVEEWQNLPFLRSCVLESLRLWPTTPLVLRETTQEIAFESGTMPADTHVMIFAPFFHRDEKFLPYAHRFAPEIWDGDQPKNNWPLIPFSGGPAECPAKRLVLLLTSNMLAALSRNRQIRLKNSSRLSAQKPLPGTLDNYALRFMLENT